MNLWNKRKTVIDGSNGVPVVCLNEIIQAQRNLQDTCNMFQIKQPKKLSFWNKVKRLFKGYRSLFREAIKKDRCGQCVHAYDGQCLTPKQAKKYRYSVACDMHFEKKGI